MNTLRPIPLHRHLGFRLSFSPARREALRTAALLAFLLTAYSIAGTLDYQDALITEARAAAQTHALRADQHQAQLLTCVNGGMSGLYSEDANGIRKYVICDRAFEISDENVKGKS